MNVKGRRRNRVLSFHWQIGARGPRSGVGNKTGVPDSHNAISEILSLSETWCREQRYQYTFSCFSLDVTGEM